MSPRPPGPARGATRPVVYHVPRTRRRWPAVLLAALALPVLVAGQLLVADLAPGPAGPDPGPVAQPDVQDPSAPPGRPTAAPELLPAPSEAPDDLVPVGTVTVGFTVGSVLDAAGREALGPVAAVLAAPDAAPVLVLGSAEPGGDEAGALELARERADVVRQALLDAGAADQLVRTRAVVDPGAGRSVVVSPDVP